MECLVFTLMCYEARSQKEEYLSICIRYTYNLLVCEQVFVFINCSLSRDSSSLSNFIFDTLKELDLNYVPMLAQLYDGTNVMSGHISGVQTRVCEKYPEFIYLHCLAHKLNLVLISTCKNVQGAINFFNMLEALYVHFSHPSSHHTFLEAQ